MNDWKRDDGDQLLAKKLRSRIWKQRTAARDDQLMSESNAAQKLSPQFFSKVTSNFSSASSLLDDTDHSTAFFEDEPSALIVPLKAPRTVEGGAGLGVRATLVP